MKFVDNLESGQYVVAENERDVAIICEKIYGKADCEIGQILNDPNYPDSNAIYCVQFFTGLHHYLGCAASLRNQGHERVKFKQQREHNMFNFFKYQTDPEIVEELWPEYA